MRTLLVELAVLIQARMSGSQLEWHAHRRAALESGLADEICDALREVYGTYEETSIT